MNRLIINYIHLSVSSYRFFLSFRRWWVDRQYYYWRQSGKWRHNNRRQIHCSYSPPSLADSIPLLSNQPTVFPLSKLFSLNDNCVNFNYAVRRNERGRVVGINIINAATARRRSRILHQCHIDPSRRGMAEAYIGTEKTSGFHPRLLRYDK